jgi:hypothetical protein
MRALNSSSMIKDTTLSRDSVTMFKEGNPQQHERKEREHNLFKHIENYNVKTSNGMLK